MASCAGLVTPLAGYQDTYGFRGNNLGNRLTVSKTVRYSHALTSSHFAVSSMDQNTSICS
jgi:hypothetical protein